jgi:hypothetical protein
VGKEHYEFYNVPKGNEIWLIGLRFKNGQAYISMKKTTTSSKVEMAPFKEVSIEDLKKELKKIDQ